MKSNLTVVVMGDSIAHGLGVQGQAYGEVLCARLQRSCKADVALKNLSYTAFQISDSLKLLSDAANAAPDVIVIAHGVTEALIRPSQKALKWVPMAWRGKGKLDPRPYFSNRPGKRLGQKILSAFRWRLKVALVRCFGGEQWTPRDPFGTQLRQAVHALRENTAAHIVLLSHCGIDDRYFPGCGAALDQYMGTVQNIVTDPRSGERVHFCDVTSLLDRWDDFFADHFHPNVMGHQRIAGVLADLVEPLLSAQMHGEAKEKNPSGMSYV